MNDRGWPQQMSFGKSRINNVMALFVHAYLTSVQLDDSWRVMEMFSVTGTQNILELKLAKLTGAD